MKLLSRFRKEKKSDGEDSQAVAEPDEGLLMPAALIQPSADSGDKSQADIDATVTAAESGGGESEGSAVSAEDDDPLEAAESDDAEGEDDAGDPVVAAQEPPAADETEPEELAEADAEADDDDPLSAFKDVEVHTDLADLVEGIEEIAMADLLEYVRDVRGMLPATPAEDDDAA